jgi:hypothetical protein
LPIGVSVNVELAIEVVRFTGRVTLWEVTQLVRLHEARPDLITADSVQIVDEDADLSDLTPVRLEGLRDHYSQLLQRADFLLLRRSGWICRSASACSVVEFWLDGRHSRDGQGTDVCLIADVRDLDLLFSDDEIEAVAAARGFVEAARFDEAQAAIQPSAAHAE